MSYKCQNIHGILKIFLRIFDLGFYKDRTLMRRIERIAADGLYLAH
jgi:hypothetical protein